MVEDQSATIRFLADPALHGGAVPERVDTFISHLVIGPERVFKLKRAIRTNFLDFSTPDRRAAMCRREIAVNRAAAILYRGVRAITREGAGLTLDGPGAPVDWVVEMVPFDRSTEFDRLAERGALTIAQIEALADRVAWLHATAPSRPDPTGLAGRIDQIAGAIAEADASGRLAAPAAGWREAAQAALAPLARRAAARARHGFVRHGHGDLHLRNICLHDGQPMPFDALEFSDEIATTDILYDAAFTLMDLLARGLTGHAAAFAARYLSATRDYAGLSLLPLFVSMRAAVRAIPASADPDPSLAQLDLANRLLARRAAPRLVAVGGPSGSGKSTLARALAPMLGAPFFAVVLRSDVARKRLMGVAPEAPLEAAAYAPSVNAAVYRRLLADARRCLQAGFAVVLDATCLDSKSQQAAAALATACGVPFTGFWLNGPQAVLASRIEARRADPSDATAAVLARQLASHPDAPGWVHLDATAGREAMAEAALAALQPD